MLGFVRAAAQRFGVDARSSVVTKSARWILAFRFGSGTQSARHCFFNQADCAPGNLKAIEKRCRSAALAKGQPETEGLSHRPPKQEPSAVNIDGDQELREQSISNQTCFPREDRLRMHACLDT